MRDTPGVRGTVPILLTALLASGSAAGCGSDDGPSTTGLATPGAAAPPATTGSLPGAAPAPTTTTTATEATVPADQPMPCPSNKGGGGAGSFDARELEGRTLSAAEDEAKAHGCSVRVARRDGEDLILTQDLRPSRINVAVTDGRVTRVLSVA